MRDRERRYFTDAARAAALAARRVKLEEADAFGTPELFVVKAEGRTFTWELRRFGGIVLQRGPEAFATMALARADGERALGALRATPGLPTFRRQMESRAQTPASPRSGDKAGG